MAEWQSPEHLADHFAKHGHEVGASAIEEYEASARALLARDDTIIFSYEDLLTAETRVGIYHRATQLFTALSDDDRWIVNHFKTDDGYIRGLMRR